MDNERLLEDQLFPDNFAKREILSLTVRCPNSDCADKMELRHLEVSTHLTLKAAQTGKRKYEFKNTSV